MRDLSYIFCFLLIISITSAENITINNTKGKINDHVKLSTPVKHFATKGNNNHPDIFMNVVTYKETISGHYLAYGSVVLYNSKLYSNLYCGFTKNEPKQDDINEFEKYEIKNTSFNIQIDIEIYYYYSANYFSCFACNDNMCNKSVIDFSSENKKIVIISLISLATLLIYCCCCWGCRYCAIRRSRVEKSKNNLVNDDINAEMNVTSNQSMELSIPILPSSEEP